MRNGKDITQQNNAKYMAKESAVKRAEVIVSTSIAAASGYLKDYSFTNVLIDEASQAHELSCLVPIMHGCEQLVLVGDHCQLPPSISSEAAKSDGLDVSLYDRLVKKGVPCFLLDTQYRMHPKIAEFSSDAFYAGRVKNGVPASDRPTLRGINWPVPGCGVVFINRGIQWGGEKSDGVSKSNEDEANLVATVVRDVLAQGEIGINDIGVISPYSAQVRLLRRTLSLYRNQGRGGGGGGGGGGIRPCRMDRWGAGDRVPCPCKTTTTTTTTIMVVTTIMATTTTITTTKAGMGEEEATTKAAATEDSLQLPNPPPKTSKSPPLTASKAARRSSSSSRRSAATATTRWDSWRTGDGSTLPSPGRSRGLSSLGMRRR